ncbi:hypothetical protein RGUI_3979 [Rhodovulum sp. P5]|uniref:VPLPA-CTERM sorting domain-containing protein n=1 Tax=Rhodovulum sp. P5 TaxID=1564506 RepID=UPI0009C25DBA|nr:VPLPA-CTERM sorting domain-containing protein [Rhodovulum sp. P5]ARE42120.1 hypothetical protein RGUI_3979 [Rhodovulum sp. P5]
MKQPLKVLCVCAGLAGLATAASAANIEAPLPDNAYITMGGLDWAWAYPYNSDHSGFDLSYQSAYGWRLATADELLSAPSPSDFIFDGANVPLGGTDPISGATFHVVDALLTGDAACATPYFSSGSWNHCDWGDAPGNLGPEGPWWGQPGAETYAELLVVRVAADIPVPAGLGLLITGLGALVGMKHRRKAS